MGRIDTAPIGDPIELAVAAADPEARVVRFAIDGAVAGVCDPAQPDEDCRRDDVWRWTVVFRDAGTHVLTATVDGDDGVLVSCKGESQMVKGVVTTTFVVELPKGDKASFDCHLETDKDPASAIAICKSIRKKS